jgi:hypothetical protein
MPPRAIRKNLTCGRAETIANKRTEGHGLIQDNTPVIAPVSTPAVSTIPIATTTSNNTIKPLDISQLKFLKIKPKQYISFD